ncbi:MAG: FMN-binding protein [Planctomycetes bacterium]|jgi:Na+-transporting NADH:ubiquinone oxidoreductase subunit C|nr:FMN-binding protein [Planctomycetota bacterium]
MPRFDPDRNPFYVIVYAAVISAAFTAAIVALHVATVDIVERNAKVMEQKAVVDVFDLGDVEQMSDAEIIDAYEQRIVRVPVDPAERGPAPTKKDGTGRAYVFAFQAGAGPDARPMAVAIPIHGIGFWANIEGLLAIDVETRKAISVTFLSHSETPGLGGRITEANFRNEWKGLDMTPPEGDGTWVYVGGTETVANADRYVDAISGATGTSNAVGDFANKTIPEYYAPAMKLAQMPRDQLDAMAAGEPRKPDTGETPGPPTPLTPEPQEEN